MREGGISKLKTAITASVVMGISVAITASAASAPTPPTLASTGPTLRWTAIPGATHYRLTEVAASGERKNFYLGNTLSYAPPAVAGSATFRVKSRPPQSSGWSNSVVVTYAHEGGQLEREATEAAEREATERRKREEREVREREEVARTGPATLLSPTGPFDCAGRLGSECEMQHFGCKPPLCSSDFRSPNPLPLGSKEVGPLSTITTAKGYEELFAEIRSLQGQGHPVILAPNAGGQPELEYSLATFFLFDGGHDYISEAGDPTWSGWFAHFGSTVQGVRKFSGLWSRSTSEGWAIVALPGTVTHTIVLPYPMSTPAGYRISSITLSGGQGAVLQCSPIPSRGDCPGYGSYGEKEEVPASLNPFPFE
jgi:hypothetical protein